MTDLQVVFDTVKATYAKPEDTDFPVNKIRFYMDFLWNGITEQPLDDTARGELKKFIDLLNFMDDHKLDTTRDMITALNPQLTPMIATYPSLAHTCTVVITTTIPAYQKYLTLLEDHVKNARSFTPSDVLLYYDMTLLDHLFLSHFFEKLEHINLLELIETIKALIVLNALVHDYLQDATAKSISMFTFIQRGGVPKEKVLDYLQQVVNVLDDGLTKSVQDQTLIALYRFLEAKLLALALAASTSQSTGVDPQQPVDNATQTPLDSQELPGNTTPPLPTTAAPTTVNPPVTPASAPATTVFETPTLVAPQQSE